ncbi:ankyrin repeat domain-containing protein [Wolbachia endosymbiont (group B) of Sphaerophoria taeniata]|uniref:ankyrin repeat domain-containing protein n=1 Tax=Wolbachia endosymbiont (group B) of Sphaerophoria taeniata TaxID=2954058 RepID=UPI00221FFB2A|nr:ankyrin repeat domain-containing protein [Wolbachia endosymbiont (group B) of Sphaerophoria taeniata]
MLKVEHPTDYLKGVNSEIVDLLKEEQRIEQQAWKRKYILNRLKRSNDYDQEHSWQTLEDETEKGNYQYWLQQHDISHIARIEYNYKEDEEGTGGVLFSIVGDLDHLSNQFIKFRNQSRSNLILISIINLGDNHLVTLVNNKRDGKFYAYYCDSFGRTLQLRQDDSQDKRDLIRKLNNINQKIDSLRINETIEIERKEEAVKNGQPYTGNLNDIQSKLKALREEKKDDIINKMSMSTGYIASALMETLGVTSDDIKSFQVQQQTDSHNCGIFAIDNTKKIVDMLIEGKSFDEMNILLSQDIPNQEDLINKRRDFSRKLSNDYERKQFVISNFALVQDLDMNDLKLLLKSAIEKNYFNIAAVAVEKGASTEGISDFQKTKLLDYIIKIHPESDSKLQPGPSNANQGSQPDNTQPVSRQQSPGLSGDRLKRSDNDPNKAGSSQQSSSDNSQSVRDTINSAQHHQSPDSTKSLEETIRLRKISINNRELLIAAGQGKSEEVSKLIGNADVNFVDRDGNTALHYAVQSSNDNSKLNVVKLLIGCGARIDTENHQNETPFDIAIRLNNEKIIEEFGKKIIGRSAEILKDTEKTTSQGGKNIKSEVASKNTQASSKHSKEEIMEREVENVNKKIEALKQLLGSDLKNIPDYKKAMIFILFIETFSFQGSRDEALRTTLKKKFLEESTKKESTKPKNGGKNQKGKSNQDNEKGIIEEYRSLFLKSKKKKFESNDINNIIDIDQFLQDLKEELSLLNKKINNKKINVEKLLKEEKEFSAKRAKLMKDSKDSENNSDPYGKLINLENEVSEGGVDLYQKWFDFIVNIYPKLEIKEKESSILRREIKHLRNNLVHSFYSYGVYEFREAVINLRQKLFCYVYAKQAGESIVSLSIYSNPNEIEEELKKHLWDIKSKFTDTEALSSEEAGQLFGYRVVKSLYPSLSPIEERSEAFLKELVIDYWQYLLPIDIGITQDFSNNEFDDESDLKKLDSISRRKLFEKFIELKRNKLIFPGYYNQAKENLKKEVEGYGYNTLSFNQICKKYFEDNNKLDEETNKIIDKIVKFIGATHIVKAILSDKSNIVSFARRFLKVQDENAKNELVLDELLLKNEVKDKLNKKKETSEKIRQLINLEKDLREIPIDIEILGKKEKVDVTKTIINVFEMLYNAYNEYKVDFDSKDIFATRSFLNELIERIENNNIPIIIERLIGIHYMMPLVSALIVKVAKPPPPVQVTNNTNLQKLIYNMLDSKEYADYLKDLLKVPYGEKFNFYKEFYRGVCEKNIDIQSISLVFKEPENIKGFIGVLINEFEESGNSEDGKKKDKIVELAKSLLEVINNEIADKYYYKNTNIKESEVLEAAEKIADLKDAIGERYPDFSGFADMNILKARIKNREGKFKKKPNGDAGGEFSDSLTTLTKLEQDLKPNKVNDELKASYLMTLSDIAYTYHLQNEYKKAREKYGILYNEIVKYSLNLWSGINNEDSNIDWKLYSEVKNSKKYKNLLYHSELLHSEKYLNILNVLKNVAYMILKSGSNDGNALKIYQKVYLFTKEELGPDSREAIQVSGYIAQTNGKIGDAYNKNRQYQDALSYYQSALIRYNKVYDAREEMLGNHRLISKTTEKITKILNNIAYTHNLPGLSNNPEEALEHHKKALEIYQQVYEFQKGSLGEKHEYTLKTIKNVAFTHHQLSRLYDKVGNIDEAISHCQANLLRLEVNSEEYKKARSFLDTLKSKKIEQSPSSPEKCLKGRKKRNAEGECLFTWEDVDEFNEEKDEKRDLSKIKIDSERFVNYIKDLPKEKQSQLIQLASEVKTVGSAQGLVSNLIGNQKVMNHLGKMGKISGMTMHGMMAKNVLADFLNGNYQGVAVNVGFIAGGQGFAKVAEAASLKGLKLAEEGKLLVGQSLKAASPFLARGTSAFVVYDLVNQIKAFKNGTEEALVGVVGDSIYLGVDAAEIGVEVAEAFGVLEGVSSVTGPIGATIGAVVFVGTDIYMAVKRVEKIDQIIHLKGDERFVEGLRAFIGIKPEQYIEELMEKKQLYNQLVKQGLGYLKQHSDIQSYVFPTTDKLDSKVLLDRKRTGIRWSRARPDDLNEGRVFCLPQGNDEPAPDYGSYLCENAIGIFANKTGNHTLINLGEGKDYAKGFLNSPNIFVVNNGSKEYYGGNKDDIFVLQANYIKGHLLGEGGINTLDTTLFALQEEQLNIQLEIGEIADYFRDNWLKICEINKVIGRANKAETITVSCDGCNSNVRLIDGQSGNEEIKDRINIIDDSCDYQMQIVVRPNTVVYNRALKGSFDYLVPLNSSGSAELSFIYGPERFNVNNTFWFAYQAVDIKSIDVKYINVFNRTEHEVKFNFVESNKEFNVTISYSENPAYRLGKSGEIRIGNKGNLYMLESSDKSSEEVIRNYLPVANRVSKMSFFIQSVLSNETVVIGSGNHEVIHSNPAYRSHLVGNGGENVYVIDSETKEVIIHDVDEENSIDTIDLRNVVRKGNHELKVIRFENDLLLRATVKEQAEYCTVRLKDGVERYNKTHVILENVPMTISVDNDEWSLKPQPLMFEKDKEVIVVTGQDVEEGNEIITPRKGGNYKFVRSNDNDLMITNAFDSTITKNDLCSITLSKFYETPRMKTLCIKFADKEIVLKDHEKEISAARDINIVKREYKDQVYNDVFNPEVMMLSDQPVTHRHRHSRHREQARHRRSTTSSSTRPTGWINDLFGWVKSSVSGLLSSKPESTKSPISQVDARVDVNGTIMLLDMLIRKVTGQKYVSTADQSISPLEAQGYALNITKGFEKVVEQAGLKSGVSMHRLSIDYMGMQKEITRKVMSGKFNEISGILSSYVEKACPDGEAGKLSPKKFDKFMIEFNKGLDITLNQSIEHNGNGRLEVNDVKEQQISLEPQSYLSNASIQGHLTRNKVKLIS